jgi:hypothetical protein
MLPVAILKAARDVLMRHICEASPTHASQPADPEELTVISCLEQSSDAFQAHQSGPEMHLSGFAGANHVSPTQVLDEAAVEYEDDDYWDVQSDEEMADQEDGVTDDTTLASKDFEIIRRIHFENSNDLSVRRYDDFLYEGLLSHYKPEYAASPLRNPKTARVFAHFIHVVRLHSTQIEYSPLIFTAYRGP